MKPKWPDQLELCLEAAYKKSEPWDSDVKDAIFENRKQTFQKHENDFEGSKAEILRGSELVGKVARVCADHDGRPNVSVNDMIAGIAAAVHSCKARLTARSGANMFFLWCE